MCGRALTFRLFVAVPLLVGAGVTAKAQSTMAAYQILAGKQFVDLTHGFGPDTPVWSGFGQAKMSPTSNPETKQPYTIAKDSFRSTTYEMVGQYGTHVDPPAHFDEHGATLDKIDLKQMILPLIVLDDTPFLAQDPNHAFSLDDLTAWESKHGRVPEGSFVALRTDMSRDWDSNPERFKRSPFPLGRSRPSSSCTSSAASPRPVTNRGITATGHESMDTDITDRMESETYILKNGHYQIEVMANLDKVPATGAVIVVTWPKVKDGLGFPARAFAILP